MSAPFTDTKINSGGAGTDFGPSTPFILFQPFNMLSFLSFFSPIILATLVLSYSFFFQNVKGLVYLGFLIAMVTLRSFVLEAGGAKKNANDNCGFVKYGAYGNATFTTFVFAFTMMYLFLPMYQTGNTNFVILIVLFFYVFIDIGIKTIQGCLRMPNNMPDIIGDFISGALLGAMIVSLMYLGGSGKYLFFTEATQNGTVCSMPKKQTFRCAVYKNGELVSASTTT